MNKYKVAYISGENYVSRGAVTESGGTTYIEATNDISINTINIKISPIPSFLLI